MFMMYQNNFSNFGYNPFSFGGYNPYANLLTNIPYGMSGFQQFPSLPAFPTMPMYGSSVFNSYMNTNPYPVSGFGSYNYQMPSLNFNFPAVNSAALTTPSFNTNFSTNPNPFSASTVKTNTNTQTQPTAQSKVQPAKTDTQINEKELSSQGMTLKNKGKGTQYGPEFLDKVKTIAKNLNCSYRDLLAIMNSESSIDAKTVGYNGASGLICFMPQYFDVKKIRQMSPMEQLDLVEKTLKDTKKQAGFALDAKLSKGDLYALVFLPARAGRDVLCTKGECGKNGKLLRYYEANSALDYNHDGKITKDEMATRIDKKYVSDFSFLA